VSLPQIVKAMQQSGATEADYPNQTEKNLITFLANGTSAPYAYSYIDVNSSGTTTSSDSLAWLQYVANGSTPNIAANEFIYNVVELLLEDEFANPGKYNSNLFLGDYYRADLLLKANGTGNVLVPNNDVRVANNLFASSMVTNDIIVNQDLEINEIVITDSIIEIDDNFISTTISNANLELRADRNVIVPSNDVVINQNLTSNKVTSLKDTNIEGTITHTGDSNQTGNLNVVGTVTVSTSNIQSEVQFDNILINDNFLETQDSNADLELRANGSGIINILENNTTIKNNLTLGTLDSNNITVLALESDKFIASDNIRIFDNVIETTISNSNLELRTLGSATVLENIRFKDDTLSTISTPINLVTENLITNATGAIKLPTGTTLERQINDRIIRFNTDDNVFEAISVSNKIVSFNGVYSSNRATSVLADPTDNIINFNISGQNVGSIDSDKLSIHGIDVDDISIQTNNIRTDNTNSDLDLRVHGTGKLEINDITITGSTIENNNSSAATTLTGTLNYRVKFNNSLGLVIPYGDTSERPGTAEVGTARWNTDEEVFEIWDGTTFITAAGTSATISAADMDDLILEYTLIFG
jgi:hypothetical protein